MSDRSVRYSIGQIQDKEGEQQSSPRDTCKREDSCGDGDRVLIQGLHTPEHLFLINIGRYSITEMDF